MAEHTSLNSASVVLTTLGKLLPDLEPLYKDIHAHPELSMHETRTAGIAADKLRKAGYEVTTGVGKTGVVGLLRNGEGPTVMLRADMDALPIAENTGLAYASKISAKDDDGNDVPVGHMCGHDMHVAWLVGAATVLSQARDAWKGTLMAVFQPGEETAQGAQAMIDDGLLKRLPTPDVVLGQHVMVSPAGSVAGSAGPITSAAANPSVRAWCAWLDAAGKHRSHRHGGIRRPAAPDHRVPRGCRKRRRGGHGRRVAGRHERERHSRRSHHQAQCADVRCRRAQAMPRPKPRGRRANRRLHRSTATRST